MLGTASEYQFYSTVSNYTQRIFYSLDVRDLGVDQMLLYEHTNREVGHNKYSDEDLIRGPVLGHRPRSRHGATRRIDAVVSTFRWAYDDINRRPGNAAAIARRYFGGDPSSNPGSFEQSVQVMLGGDEVYVAAHPLLAALTPEIIRRLDAATVDGDRPLDLRAS